MDVAFPRQVPHAFDRFVQHPVDGQILGLQLVRRAATQVTYRAYAETSSASVLEAFRAMAASRRVHGVKQPCAWTRLPSPVMIDAL